MHGFNSMQVAFFILIGKNLHQMIKQ
ncbi:CRISPR-associated DxTHG motif protein [Maribacter algicola]|uniref:CRISPR-associated DxTHG motif protein n=1 Tax=Maribacter algicola TaxID=2498892 RepID=A0A3R8RR57_9FLAO|nr:CRISPR-associated DxTHG motif protein [Maribacter algicola]